MKTQLTPQQVESYRENGYVAHPGFLSPDEVKELKGAVLDAIATMGNKRLAKATDGWEDGGGFYGAVFTQRINLWLLSEVVKRYMLGPGLGRMVCELEGVPAMRVWHDQALIKEPFGNATSWHLDNPFWSFSSHHAISVWIALEDATLGNGCMWFIPGTHKMGRFETTTAGGSNMGELFKMYPEMAKIDPVPVPMKAGDCAFHNGLTAHGANCNMTRGRRIAMTCAYMPDGSTFNGQKNVLPKEYLATLKVGDVLQNDDWNPIVYSAHTPAMK